MKVRFDYTKDHRAKEKAASIVKLLAEGNTAKDIAPVFEVSDRTVEAWIGKLIHLNEVRNAAQLVYLFAKAGLI